MWQKGWQLGGSNPIDSLNYTYNTNSNKLKNVIDGRNDPLTTMGDFRTSSLSPYNTGKTTSAQDYYYDGNGNLTRDLNKDIGSQTADGIIYNHLNLPWQITVRSATGTKGTIRYIYDATGNKLKKTTADSAGNTQTVTTYIGGFQYQGRQSISAGGIPADTLQFFGQEEGRVRVLQDTTGGKPAPTYQYDYFIKDHLGNTRMVLTDEQQTDMYPAATMEVGDSATENLYYSKLTDTRSGLPSGYPTDTTTNPNSFVIKLTGTSGHTIGPGITLKVMAGDQFSIKASSWYKTNGMNPGTPANPLTDLLAALIGGVGGIPGGHLTTTQLTTNSGLISPNVTQFLADTGTSILNTRPHAFVNWVLFDNQMNYVSASSGFDQVGTDQEFKKHILTNLPVSKSGYLYIYVSNETPNIEVFFDNLQVTHTRSPLLEEDHYYPFGLTMAGISDKALKMGYAENKYRFQKQELQNKEFSDGSGLEMYEFKYRMDDPQTGRFWSIDPLASKYAYNSTYAFSENHVTIDVELEGLELIHVNNDPTTITYGRPGDQAKVSTDVLQKTGGSNPTPSDNKAKSTPSNRDDGSKPLVGSTSTTKVTNEVTTGSPLGLGTVTVSNTTAVTKGNEGAIATLDIVHKQTTKGVETEGVGGSVGPLTASYGFDGSFSIGAQVKDEASGTDLHASFGVGSMNGNEVLSAGMTSKGSGGVSTSVDHSYTPGLSGIALAGLFIMSTVQPEVSIPLLKALPKNLAPAH